MIIAEVRCHAKKTETNTVIKSTPIPSSENDEAESEPTRKLSDGRLIHALKLQKNFHFTTDSVVTQFDKFLREEGQQQVLDAVANWRQSSATYPAFGLIAKVLCVPATSAPVERVFSQGGIIARPHRSSTSPSRVQILTLLKYNEHIFDVSDFCLVHFLLCSCK